MEEVLPTIAIAIEASANAQDMTEDMAEKKIRLGKELMSASKRGDVARVVELLDETGIDPDYKNEKEETALMWAAGQGNLDMVSKLIESDRVSKDTVNAADKDGDTALIIAAWHGHHKTVEKLIQAKARVDKSNKKQETALMVAAWHGHLQTVTTLIQCNANVDQARKDGDTALIIAAWHGQLQTVSKLITAGASVNTRNKVDTNGTVDKRNHRTALMAAAGQGHVDTVSKLIDSKANVDAVNEDKKTALILAAEGGHNGVVSKLMVSASGASASVNASDKHGMTALMAAACRGHLETVNMLIKLKASVDAPDNNGESAIILAAREGHQKIVNKLIESKAKIVMEKDENKNALRVAIDSGHEDVAMEIIKNGEEVWGLALTYSTLEQLITKMPSVVELVFDQCIKCNGERMVLDYFYESQHSNDNRNKHPLTIMVESKRVNLLNHPLVDSFIAHTWKTSGFVFYLLNLAIYIAFLALLTTFALIVPNPQACSERLDAERLANNTTSLNVSIDCNILQSDTRRKFVGAAIIIVIIIAVVRLVIQVFLMIRLKNYWKNWVNWLELPLIVFAIMFVAVFNNECHCPQNWQWQVGIIAVFLAWINLAISMSKLPYVGIYIIMFIGIFKIFLWLIFLCTLLLVTFGLPLYMAFFEPGVTRTPFASPARSLLKTITMTTGALTTDGIFRQVPGGTQETDEGLAEIPFPTITYILWIVFIVLMVILLNNLLVGLVVVNIKDAKLAEIALKVELVLSIQQLLPGISMKKAILPKTVQYHTNQHQTDVHKDDLKEHMKQLQRQNETLATDMNHIKQAIIRMEEYIQRMASDMPVQ